MKKSLPLFAALLLFAAGFISSCAKKNADAPPDLTGYDPQLPVNLTIAQLKAKMTTAEARKIDSDWTICGIVSADDRSGNFYKQINMEDSTGGITINIDAYNLCNKYPVGRKVYVHLKGLWYGYYYKFPQLGDTVDYTGAIASIPGTSADNYIVKGNFPNPVAVHEFADLSQLKAVNAAMVGRLVKIDSVQVAATDTGNYFAQPAFVTSGTSINLEDCSGNKIVMRTSGYATFFNQKVPKGKGSITALYTIFNATPQLVIRDTTDMQFYGARCSGGGGGTVTSGGLITIDSLRKLYSGTANITLGSAKITGVVISDIDKGNSAAGNFIIEDGSRRGIDLYINGSSAYKLGDSLLMDVTGGKLQLYNGGLELSGVTASKITKVATGKTVQPTTVTISQLNADFALYESTLVKLLNVGITPAGTFSGNKTLNDGTGTISLYTAPGAVFSGQTAPAGNKTVVGIATPYTGTPPNELKLRDATDVY